MYNDLFNTRNGDPLVYNIIKEINSKFAPSGNFSNIYGFIEKAKKPHNAYPN
jgi:hypothetical protein